MRRLTLLALLVVLAGCDLAEEDFQPQVVVDGFLVAGEVLSTVRLSETAPIDAVYSFEAFALSGAEVQVALLAEDGAVEQVYPFRELQDFAGNYVAATLPLPRVLSGRRYRLEARLPDRPDLVPVGEAVRAETTVPDSFRVVTPPPDTVAYDIDAPSPALDVTPSTVPGRPAVFLFNVQALDPGTYGLTPTLAELIEDTDAEPGDFVETASPLLNEGNYDHNPDGTLTIRVPWLSIAFFGPNRFTANALDDALYDFLRSRNAQFNPSTLAPGEIQDILSNVENGTGAFGSIARVSVEVFIAE